MTQERSYGNGDTKDQLALNTHIQNWTERVLQYGEYDQRAWARAANGGKVTRKTRVSLPRSV